jgi:hypothetical protein
VFAPCQSSIICLLGSFSKLVMMHLPIIVSKCNGLGCGKVPIFLVFFFLFCLATIRSISEVLCQTLGTFKVVLATMRTNYLIVVHVIVVCYNNFVTMLQNVTFIMVVEATCPYFWLLGMKVLSFPQKWCHPLYRSHLTD